MSAFSAYQKHNDKAKFVQEISGQPSPKMVIADANSVQTSRLRSPFVTINWLLLEAS